MKQRGFTLIELMVSVAIFAIVMTIALGALLAISTADRKAETLASVMNNLNFAAESMTRNIRTGYDYDCGAGGGDCPGGDTSFAFTGPAGDDIVYSFSNSSSLCGQTVGCIVRSINGGSFAAITAPEVQVTHLTFYLRGSTLGSAVCWTDPNDPDTYYACNDDVQPNVVIVITGSIQVTPTLSSNFTLQTSATQGLYDR